MILSYEHEYIFFKARKVAGTSVQVALSKSCGEDDLITKIMPSEYEGYQSMNDEHIHTHMTPEEFKKIYPTEYEDFDKITIIRNPWDYVVSVYWWDRGRAPKRSKSNYPQMQFPDSFEEYVMRERFEPKNDIFYFGEYGEKIMDRYIRFENLQSDYDDLCNFLGIKTEVLPRLKIEYRKDKRHYSQYYNEGTREFIACIFKKQIKEFGYEFEYD